MAWSTPKTWTAGELVDVAEMNQEVRDNLNAIVPNGPGAWTAYTPTLTQSGAVTKTVTYARYMRLGRLIVVQGLLAVTGSGSASNAVVVGLPVAAAQAGNMNCGTGFIFDTSAVAGYAGHAILTSTTSIQFRPSTVTATGVLGATTFTDALASGDTIDFSVSYEAAS